MASGTPLVAFDLPCIKEEYKPYFYQMPEYSAESMRSFIEDLLTLSNEEIHDFGIRAQSWIVANKQPKIQTKKYIDCISQIKF